MSAGESITIARRFHGPRDSGNGGYVCGRLAAFINGTVRVRLYVPPPLDTPMDVRHRNGSVTLEHAGMRVAEAWPDHLDPEIPRPPSPEDATAASTRFRGFRSHRFATCFVCGVDREPDDGLRIFAGPVPGRDIVACTWRPPAEFATPDGTLAAEFVWCALDCPGGFAFPEPDAGTILLGELSVVRYGPLRPDELYVVCGWEISRDGRKHRTGTALFSSEGSPVAAGQGTWFEVPEGTIA